MVAVLVAAVLVTALTLIVAGSLVASMIKDRALDPIPLPVENRSRTRRP